MRQAANLKTNPHMLLLLLELHELHDRIVAARREGRWATAATVIVHGGMQLENGGLLLLLLLRLRQRLLGTSDDTGGGGLFGRLGALLGNHRRRRLRVTWLLHATI